MERFPGQGRFRSSSQPDDEQIPEQGAPLVPSHGAVLALQRTAGNAAVSALMIARQPEGLEGLELELPSPSEEYRDAKPVDWRQMAAPAQGPKEPPRLRIPHGSHTPEPPGGYRAGGGIVETSRQIDRDRCWEAWESKIGELEATWNGVRDDIRLFNDATIGIPDIPGTEADEERQSLTKTHRLQPQKSGSLTDVVNAQVVPRTSGSGTNIGQLFGDGDTASTNGLDDNIARAGRSADVEEQLERIREADAELEAQLITLAASNDEAGAAGDAVLAARAAIDEETAGDDRATAEADKAAIEERIATIKTAVGISLDVIATGATLLGRFKPKAKGGSGKKRKGAAKTEEEGGAADAFAGVAANDLVSTVAEGVVSLFFRGELAAAQAAIDAAAAREEEAHDTKLSKLLSSALKHHSAALKEVQSGAKRVEARLARRRAEYLDLAQAAGRAGGGSNSERDRLSAMIAAIPLVDAAVAAAGAVSAKIVEPEYTREAGSGFGIARYHGFASTGLFVQSLGVLQGYKIEFETETARWVRRRASLGAVIAQLEKVPARGR